MPFKKKKPPCSFVGCNKNIINIPTKHIISLQPPRQVVTPYKPSEDLEQVPLINPNSPSHLTGASGTTPYPMLASNKPDTRTDADEVDLSCT